MTDETTTEPVRHITIAFDGACIGNPGPGGYGAFLVNEITGREKIVRGRDPETTNNKMELSAAIAGLNALRPGATVSMIGDSQYVIKGITEWMPGWKAKGWRTSAGKPVLNVELWQALELAVAQHEAVSWTWVKGHAGHPLNERADKIASDEALSA
ncbi:ribonuclease HI [Methylobacterium sp. J-067]|uniref:ribonuclease HI n=1 Tax=Methylobacterium sp. J-067 TaxID=2836648 RepID=UPI001FBAACA5|nr:ribonuclease HI [Methylobacterium sp. J-067]MCJ2025039.1 ribonuclease HI [Methylobacterium sp. J-067]